MACAKCMVFDRLSTPAGRKLAEPTQLSCPFCPVAMEQPQYNIFHRKRCGMLVCVL